jgi:beta-mannosidase
MNQTIDLNGTWQLRWNDGERGERANRVLAGDVNWSRAWSASVPGSVHETLLEHGVIPDPGIGTNVLACRWVEETVWFYRRTFKLPNLRKGDRAWLFFETLDLAANIYLNGVQIGSHANAFRPCRVEATSLLRNGDNELVVEIESGIFHAMTRSSEGYGLRLNHRQTKSNWLRKTQSEFGWDWSPRLVNVGMPGGVRLEICSGIRWDNAVLISDLSADLSQGSVTARVFAENLTAKPTSGELLLKLGKSNNLVRVPVLLQPGMNKLEAVLPVANPKLWWPIGHGKQTRSEVTVELVVAGKTEGTLTLKIGFRHVRVNQEKHPERGRYFIIEINGKPIFCKGGNYVPADLILSRIDRRRHAALIDRALEANCNFLRVWGGGVYESDDFYDLCDEKGIMVWQDFIFACGKYPATDEAFLADVTQEARHQVRRLAHHPSLVAWCGNNEIEQGNWEWDYEQGVAFPDYALYHLVLPRLMREEDPGRYYQPSSPFSPDGESPTADHLGDQHPWSLGFSDNDFRKYRDMICRFPNEGGILGPNNLLATRECFGDTPGKIGTFPWEIHDNAVTSWDKIPAYAPDLMFEQWLGKSTGSLSLEDYVYWGGVLQGLGLSEYIKNFRRRMFDSSAAVFWMFNDMWPCTRSWTIVDWKQRRNPAFWPVRRAFAPVTVVVTREEKSVKVYGINEGDEITATLRFGLMALSGKYPLDESKAVTLPANASTVIAEFPAAQWDKLGIKTHVAFAVLSNNGSEIARDCLILPLFREMKWPKAKVSVTCKGGKAIFTSDTFAWRVCIDLEGKESLADNFFDIYPGIPTVLAWPDNLAAPKVLLSGFI